MILGKLVAFLFAKVGNEGKDFLATLRLQRGGYMCLVT
jgi:hypothetical protein